MFLIDEIKTNALNRLTTEYELSKSALTTGGHINDEKHILETWTSYYVETLERMKEIPIDTVSEKISSRIIKKQTEVKSKGNFFVNQLNK